MEKYVMQELSLFIPPQWRDQTINAFVLPSSDGKGEASLVITRDADSGYKELNEFADQQLVKAAQKFKKYKLIIRNSQNVNSFSAIQADYSWETPEHVCVRQRQLYMKCKFGFIIFTLTSKANQMELYDVIWNQVIGSIALA